MVAEFDVNGGKAKGAGRQLVHDHREVVDLDKGHADDHAAPAIIQDVTRDRLLLATSYHGSDLFLYEKPLGSAQPFKPLVQIAGRYTYPRFLLANGETFLLARRQSEGVLDGDLVMRSSRDGFASEQVVIPSREGHVIYASIPAIHESSMYIQYSTLSYESRRLEGWDLVEYDLDSGAIKKGVDLSGLMPRECAHNRPTGLAVDEDVITASTACFRQGFEPAKPEYRFFSRRNDIRILELPRERLGASHAQVIHDGEAIAPYYHTSVSIHPDGTWVYFDEAEIRSNREVPSACRPTSLSMYPNLTSSALYHAVPVHGFYESRNFHNELHRCTWTR
ncbi:hypothetical protein [Halothiobacillus sp.]|uniref:hypothetical protein n=1 Tax=Halothiobacillus sp. TaxID=1891311 RepID=UPI002AD542EC|nr:hypothetical protein [Halothiobacillus sp.]